MHLPLWLRKKIMYNLIIVIPDKIEFVKTSIIASTGEILPSAESWFRNCAADCTGAAPLGTVLTESDVRAAEDGMAKSLDNLYTRTCDLEGEEGQVFKDVNSPYALGNENRNKGFWHKV
jgi:hypothetical protein